MEPKQQPEAHTLPKLGIIAGGGELPERVINECIRQQREMFVIAIEGKTHPDAVQDTPHQWLHIGKIGEAIKTLKKEKAQELVLVGRVGRPDIASLRLDYGALRLLSRFTRLSSYGDDAVFTAIIRFFEQSGFRVIGVDNVLKDLLIEEGALGKHRPDKAAQRDIDIGMHAALVIGDLDVGQAVIVQQGQILGVEGAEGTDRLVERCKDLHQNGAGGVLVKMKKPHQDARVDLPSIGIKTIENAYYNGLRGIAVEAGGALVINREKVIEKADELGMFVVGIMPPSR